MIQEAIGMLSEEGADCIKDYMRMGYSREEARKECKGANNYIIPTSLDADGDGVLTISEIKSRSLLNILEGDVVDLFPKDKPAPQDKDMLANALAKRAMEMAGQRADRAENMVDLDGDKNNIDVNIDIDFDPELYRLFLSPYTDDYDGKESPPLAEYIYKNYVLFRRGHCYSNEISRR